MTEEAKRIKQRLDENRTRKAERVFSETKVYIDPLELQSAVLQFIGSDYYAKMLSNIQDTKESGFLVGLTTGAMLTSWCTPYYAVTAEE